MVCSLKCQKLQYFFYILGLSPLYIEILCLNLPSTSMIIEKYSLRRSVPLIFVHLKINKLTHNSKLIFFWSPSHA